MRAVMRPRIRLWAAHKGHRGLDRYIDALRRTYSINLRSRKSRLMIRRRAGFEAQELLVGRVALPDTAGR